MCGDWEGGNSTLREVVGYPCCFFALRKLKIERKRISIYLSEYVNTFGQRKVRACMRYQYLFAAFLKFTYSPPLSAHLPSHLSHQTWTLSQKITPISMQNLRFQTEKLCLVPDSNWRPWDIFNFHIEVIAMRDYETHVITDYTNETCYCCWWRANHNLDYLTVGKGVESWVLGAVKVGGVGIECGTANFGRESTERRLRNGLRAVWRLRVGA